MRAGNIKENGFTEILIEKEAEKNWFNLFLEMKKWCWLAGEDARLKVGSGKLSHDDNGLLFRIDTQYDLKIRDCLRGLMEEEFGKFIAIFFKYLGLAIMRGSDSEDSRRPFIYWGDENVLEVHCKEVGISCDGSRRGFYEPIFKFDLSDGLAAKCTLRTRSKIFVETLPAIFGILAPSEKSEGKLDEKRKFSTICSPENFDNFDVVALEIRPVDAVPRFLKFAQDFYRKYSAEQLREILLSLQTKGLEHKLGLIMPKA